jgi:prevent-host-death family protein
MSSKEVGIEEARKRLGDLVTAAQQGTDIILTRNGKPAARLTPYMEDTMTVTTATTYGADFSSDKQTDGIYAYINGGDYSEEQQGKLVDAMMAALREEVDALLPEDVSWQPATSEFIHPVGDELPEHEEMREIFEAAWSAVEARYGAIEAEALA